MVCPTCGIGYAAPEWFLQNRQEKGGGWYCPKWTFIVVYGSNSAASQGTVGEQRARAQAREDLRRAEEAKKRLTKRLSSGVCPVAGCKRHFTNLQRHIETQHHGIALLPEGVTPKQIEGPVQ
jgi:hypothetical protein